MPYNKSRVSDYLELSELMLKNARKDTLINQLLTKYNVGPERYDQGLTLCTETYSLEKEQVKLHGEQFRARTKFDKLLAGGDIQ